MKRNYKLKSAVTLALSVLSLSAHHNVFALGLGDINVKSYLGQPLKAKINIYGADDANAASCFTQAGGNISNINFTLSRITAGKATLILTTNQVVNEPIVNLSIAAQCGNQFQRDYVLLLDPPLLNNEIEAVITSGVIENQQAEVLVTNNLADETASTNNEKLTHSKTVKQAKKSAKTKKAKAKPSVKSKSSASKSKKTNKPVIAKNKVNTSPKLTISGASTSVIAANTIGLRLDKNLTFTPDPNAIPLEDAEIQDEVVAMNNRLEHLTLQLSKLQNQNNKLAIENKATTEALVAANSFKDKVSYILYAMGGGLLLLGGYFSFNWLRNRQFEKQSNNTDQIWAAPVKTKEEDFADQEVSSQEPTEKEAPNYVEVFEGLDEAALFSKDEAVEGVAAHNEIETTEKTQTKEDEDLDAIMHANDTILFEEDNAELSVLDHADVFLSHGRTSLAIQLLQNHLLDHPKQSVTIWLFLLDLLAKENLKTMYEQTALECKQYFNIKIADFSTSEEIQSSETLESFPRLQKGLEDVWGKPESIVYLDDLIYNNRLEPRAGLEKSLIEELLLLKTIAQEKGNSADVIKLDEKKLKMMQDKEELLATKKAEKIEKLQESMIEKQQNEKKADNLFEFELVEWK